MSYKQPVSSTSTEGVIALTSDADVQTATSTSLAVVPSTLNSLLALAPFTGITAWGGSGSYYTVAGTNFTVDRAGTGFIKSKKMTWLGGQTIALTVGAINYIHMDSTGTIGKATSRSDADFENYVTLFEVLVDSTPVTPVVITVREDHPYNFNAVVSNWLHDNIGPIIENLSGGANLTLHGTKAVQIVGSDMLSDHGLETSIPDSGGAAITVRYMYTNGAGKWVQYSSQNTCPSVYNNAGTVTALSANRWGVFRYYVSKDDLEGSDPVYFAVINTAQYLSLAAARAAITTGVSAATNELYGLEIAQLGYVIFQQSSDSIVEVQISKTTLRNITAASGTVSTANAISTSTSTFNRILDASDTNVQVCLSDIDDKWGWIAVYKQPGAYPYDVLVTDHLISVDTSVARTIRLPNAPTTVGTLWIVKDRTGSAGANNISVTTPGGAVTIDGVTTYTITVNYGSATFVWNGTTYEVI